MAKQIARLLCNPRGDGPGPFVRISFNISNIVVTLKCGAMMTSNEDDKNSDSTFSRTDNQMSSQSFTIANSTTGVRNNETRGE